MEQYFCRRTKMVLNHCSRVWRHSWATPSIIICCWILSHSSQKSKQLASSSSSSIKKGILALKTFFPKSWKERKEVFAVKVWNNQTQLNSNNFYFSKTFIPKILVHPHSLTLSGSGCEQRGCWRRPLLCHYSIRIWINEIVLNSSQLYRVCQGFRLK